MKGMLINSMKKSKHLLFVIFVILLAMLFCACHEDPSLQTAKYKGYVTVGYYPGSYLNEPVVNVIKSAARSIGIEVYLKDQTEETWRADLHNDVIDIMIDETSDEDMLSEVLFTTKVVFVTNENVNLELGGTIGVLDVGFIRESAMAITDFHNAEYSYYAIPKMIIQDFESGYLDGIIVNEVDYLTYCTLENTDYNIINTRDIHLVFEQGDITLINAFNEKINELKENGMMQSLVYTE